MKRVWFLNLHIQKTAESYKLYILLADLQTNTIEAYKASEEKYDELNLKNQFKRLFSKASAIEESYNLFITKNKLPYEYAKTRKLKEQLDFLVTEIARLSEAYAKMS